VNLGNQGRLEGYYLNFWKGNFLVTLTGFDEEEDTVSGLISLAKAVEDRIKTQGNSQEPSLIRLLPDDGLIKSSIKYFKGHLGLFNIYSFSTKNVFQFKEGLRGSYAAGFDIYVLAYDHSKDSLEQFFQAKVYFKQNPRYRNFAAFENSLQMEDEKNNFIYILPSKNYILIIFGAKDLTQAQQIAEKIIKR
jgi:hypothetical protein